MVALVATVLVTIAATPTAAAAHSPAAGGGVSPLAFCRQNTQAWNGAFGYGILHSDIPGRTLTVPAGTPVFHTGIVVPGTRIRFQYFNIDAPGISFDVWSPQAGSNCVVAHEPATLNTGILAGTRWAVGATYIAWETNTFRNTLLGTLVVT